MWHAVECPIKTFQPWSVFRVCGCIKHRRKERRSLNQPVFKSVAPWDLLLNELPCWKRDSQLFRMGQSCLRDACGQEILKGTQRGSGGNKLGKNSLGKGIHQQQQGRKEVGFKQLFSAFFHLQTCQWAGSPLSSKPRGGPGACKAQLNTTVGLCSGKCPASAFRADLRPRWRPVRAEHTEVTTPAG